MSIPISSTGGTKKGFLDSSRPRQMEDADKIYLKVSFKTGTSAADAVGVATTLHEAITSTKGFELDQLWGKLERKLNSNRPLAVKAKDDVGKAQTAYSLFYSLLETIDTNSTSTAELRIVKGLFEEAELHIANKWYGNVTTQERRVLDRIAKTVTGRIDSMVERFNELAEEGTMPGGAI